jgi:hypothetical protein
LAESREELLRRLNELDREEAELNKRRAAAQEKELSAVEKARTDFPSFCEYVMRDEKTGNRITLADTHILGIEFIATCWLSDLFPYVQLPFGTGKTTLYGVALPLFLLGLDPSLRIKIISSKDDMATERVEVIKSYIEESDEYHEVFPHVQRDPSKKWTSHKIFAKRATKAKDASVQALGATSTAIGGRSDFNIYDDVNDLRNTILNPKDRKRVWKNYVGVFHNRLEMPPIGVGLLTRWHVEDVFGMITADPEMAHEYGFLIQAVNPDMTALDCEIILGQDPRLRPPKPVEQMSVIHRAFAKHANGLWLPKAAA